MARLCCRHGLPAILLALVLGGSAQDVVDRNSKLMQRKQSSHPSSLPGGPPIPATPKDLVVDVSCKNQAFITWGYEDITDGFLATICHEDEVLCSKKTIDASARNYTIKLQKRDESYNISLSAFWIQPPTTIYSQPATMQFSSYPEVPEVKSLTLTPLKYSAIQATWKEKWAHEIKFKVCRPLEVCEEHMIQGMQLQHTFKGLAPDTVYVIFAQAQVTHNNKTCQGIPQVRTTRTFAKPPGPVSNLKHKIVNSVYLNATWDAPNDKHDVDGYTIECRDIEGEYDVARDVSEPKPSVDVTIFLRKFASTFNCSVWAFINSNLVQRVNGTKTVFEVETHKLEPPEDLKVSVQCENQADVTWHYDVEIPITGFLATLCQMNGTLCTNKTLARNATEVSFRLLDGAQYNVSVMAYVDNSLQTIYSRPSAQHFFSFPKLPKLDDVSVSAVNSTALSASWKEKWAHEIEFHVCSTAHDCQNHTVFGMLHQYTFSGLQPDTEYNVSAQAEVTLNNRTCKGPQQSRSSSTFAEAPGNVTDLKHHIEKGIILIASWNSPKEAKAVKGYTISCVDSETGKNVTTDVDKLQPSVQVSLNLHEPIGVFNCAVWAYNMNKKGQRAPGPKTTFEVTTDGIFPPNDVKLVKHTATSLTFTWIADPTARGWNITPVAEGQLAHSAIEEYGESDNKSVTHNVTNLVPWTKYNMSIVNCRPTFCSEPTFVQSTTDVAAPSEVRDLNYTFVEDVQVQLTWKAPEHPNGPIDGYSVAVFNEDEQEGTLYDVPGHLTETTIDLKYQFNIFNISVRAYNVDEGRNETISGPVSDVFFETLGKGPMPPRPEVGAVADHSVHLSWEMPEDPRYNITGFNVSVSHRQPFITKERNLTITSLEPWMDYNINVSSCTNATECGQEEDRHFKTDVGEPSEPLDLKVSSASTDWLVVEWKEPKVHNGPLSGYNVTFNKGGVEVQETTTQLSYNLTGLAAGTSYEVSVYAFNTGLVTSKRGPGATLKATTVSDKNSTTVILLAVFIPLILLLLVAAFFLYKRYQKKTGDRVPLTTAEGH